MPITLLRPRNNDKVKKINDNLKHIMTRQHLKHPDASPRELLYHAIVIHNRTPRPSGYSPCFLLYGIQLPEKPLLLQLYTKELTEQKDYEAEKDLAKQHEAPIARGHAIGLKALRNQIRAYLQEPKALLKVYAPGD
jgi:hypothetical protein